MGITPSRSYPGISEQQCHLVPQPSTVRTLQQGELATTKQQASKAEGKEHRHLVFLLAMKGFTLAACGHEYHGNCKKCPTCGTPNPGKSAGQGEVPGTMGVEPALPPVSNNGVLQGGQETGEGDQAEAGSPGAWDRQQT